MYDWKVGWHNLLLSTWNDILIDMDMPEKNCPELTEKTADSMMILVYKNYLSQLK